MLTLVACLFGVPTANSQQDSDRQYAAALYMQARMHLVQRDPSAALRGFQRTWRYDPERVSILGEILPLSVQLDRADETTRYAILAAESDPTASSLIPRAAAILESQGQWKRAGKLYERLLADPSISGLRRFETMLSRALADQRQGNSAAAAEGLAEALRIMNNPRAGGLTVDQTQQAWSASPWTDETMGEVLLAAGRWEQARQVFQRLQGRQPDSARLALQSARAAHAGGQWDGARRELERYIESAEREPRWAAWELLAAIIHHEHEQPEPAGQALLDRLTTEHQKTPDDPALATYFGLLLKDRGRPAEALDVLLAIPPDRRLADTVAGLAEIYRGQDNPAELLELLCEEADTQRGFHRLGEQRAPIEADALLLEQLAQIAPADPAAASTRHSVVHRLAVAGGHWDIADATFASCWQSDPVQVSRCVAWSIRLMIAGRPGRAAEWLQRALDENLDPRRNAELYSYLAAARNLAAESAATSDANTPPDRQAAIQAARRATALSGQKARWAVQEPTTLLADQQYKEAEQACLRLLVRFDHEHVSTENRVAMRDVRRLLSQIDAAQGQLDQAAEWLEEVLDEFPEFHPVWNDLGYLWADQNMRLPRALAMIQRAVAVEPRNPAYLDSLGWAYYRLGRWDEAIESLEQAIAAGNTDGVAHDHLGDAYWSAGRAQQARQAWQAAAERLAGGPLRDRLERVREKIADRQ